jgi:hypothetical protein
MLHNEHLFAMQPWLSTMIQVAVANDAKGLQMMPKELGSVYGIGRGVGVAANG